MTTDDQVIHLVRDKKTSTVRDWRTGTVFSSFMMLIFMVCNLCISCVLQKAAMYQEGKESEKSKDVPLISGKKLTQEKCNNLLENIHDKC